MADSLNADDAERNVAVQLFKAGAGFVAAILLIVLLLFAFAFRFDLQSAGQFGDMFGLANAIFSGVAFLMLIIGLSLQRHELSLQRVELRQTREEFEKQSAAFQKQNEVMEQQRFEGTFFQLLRLHSQIVASLDAIGSSGSAGFFAVRLSTFMNQSLSGRRADLAVAAYQDFHKSNLEELGHHFRTLYNIVKFIDSSSLSRESKQTYMNLLRATLQKSEIIFLCLNCTTTYGRDKFKPLVEEYALLENFDWSHDYADQFRKLYDKRAFGGK